MKLGELAAVTGVSTASVKYWIREGILPPGRLRNTTTADYGPDHVDRIALVTTLRSAPDTPVPRIRDLTRLLDDPDVPLITIMEHCQILAAGLDPAEAPCPETAEAPRPGDPESPPPNGSEPGELLDSVAASAGWPQIPSAARRALARTLADLAAEGLTYSQEYLEELARGLAPVATRDVASTTDADLAVAGPGRSGGQERPDGTPAGETGQPSRDAVALRVVRGTHAQLRVVTAMTLWAHTSAAISAQG